MPRKQLSGFITYLTNEKSIDLLTDEEAGQIYKALFKVARSEISGSGEIKEPDTTPAKILFYSMAEQVRQNAAEWQSKADQNQQNAQKPRKIATAKTVSESSDR